MMHATLYSEVNDLLKVILAEMQTVLGEKLVGLYLYGSLVTGDFDFDASDIDLLAAIASDLEQAEFERLDKMHLDFIAQHPRWENRLEIAYLSLHGLKTFKTQSSPIGIISPGEPFHIIEAGKLWLVNWYFVREKGVTLYGPPPQAIIDHISREEFIEVVREHVRGWGDWINNLQSLPSQAYAILTLCRALYTITNGEQASKKQAALWAIQKLPQWATLIQNALEWRRTWREEKADAPAMLVETQQFARMVISQILD